MKNNIIQNMKVKGMKFVNFQVELLKLTFLYQKPVTLSEIFSVFLE